MGFYVLLEEKNTSGHKVTLVALVVGGLVLFLPVPLQVVPPLGGVLAQVALVDNVLMHGLPVALQVVFALGHVLTIVAGISTKKKISLYDLTKEYKTKIRRPYLE